MSNRPRNYPPMRMQALADFHYEPEYKSEELDEQRRKKRAATGGFSATETPSLADILGDSTVDQETEEEVKADAESAAFWAYPGDDLNDELGDQPVQLETIKSEAVAPVAPITPKEKVLSSAELRSNRIQELRNEVQDKFHVKAIDFVFKPDTDLAYIERAVKACEQFTEYLNYPAEQWQATEELVFLINARRKPIEGDAKRIYVSYEKIMDRGQWPAIKEQIDHFWEFGPKVLSEAEKRDRPLDKAWNRLREEYNIDIDWADRTFAELPRRISAVENILAAVENLDKGVIAELPMLKIILYSNAQNMDKQVRRRNEIRLDIKAAGDENAPTKIKNILEQGLSLAFARQIADLNPKFSDLALLDMPPLRVKATLKVLQTLQKNNVPLDLFNKLFARDNVSINQDDLNKGVLRINSELLPVKNASIITEQYKLYKRRTEPAAKEATPLAPPSFVVSKNIGLKAVATEEPVRSAEIVETVEKPKKLGPQEKLGKLVDIVEEIYKVNDDKNKFLEKALNEAEIWYAKGDQNVFNFSEDIPPGQKMIKGNFMIYGITESISDYWADWSNEQTNSGAVMLDHARQIAGPVHYFSQKVFNAEKDVIINLIEKYGTDEQKARAEQWK